MRLSDVYLRAADLIAAGTPAWYACLTLSRAVSELTYEEEEPPYDPLLHDNRARQAEVFLEVMFMPSTEEVAPAWETEGKKIFMNGWFGPAAESENQEARMTMLCFAAAMAEDDEFIKSMLRGNENERNTTENSKDSSMADGSISSKTRSNEGGQEAR